MCVVLHASVTQASDRASVPKYPLPFMLCSAGMFTKGYTYVLYSKRISLKLVVVSGHEPAITMTLEGSEFYSIPSIDKGAPRAVGCLGDFGYRHPKIVIHTLRSNLTWLEIDPPLSSS